MKLYNTPSPNWNERPAGMAVDCIVLHATADRDARAAVAWCRTPRRGNPNPVSYHVIVDRDGSIFTLVSTEKRAWHAGVSRFLERENVNDFSIGLSFANVNDGVEAYPEAQLLTGAQLVAGWMKRYPAITLDRITTHRAIAPTRKTDPAPPAFNLDAFKLLVQRELFGNCIG